MAETFDASYKGKYVNGFVQHLSTYKDFCMIMFTNAQLECINSVDPDYLGLEIDASGGLVSVPGKRVLNYVCIIKEIDKKSFSFKEGKYASIAEMSSSHHDVHQIRSFLQTIQFTYRKAFHKAFKCHRYRLFVGFDALCCTSIQSREHRRICNKSLQIEQRRNNR